MLNLLTNPLIVLLVATVVVMALMFLFVGRKKKPKKKIEKALELKKEEKSEEKTDKNDETKKEQISEKPQISEELIEISEENNENQNKTSKEKNITKVYVRQQKEQQNIQNENQEDKKYQDLSNRAEFVKTSKHVSKLNKFLSDEEIAEAVKEEVEQSIQKEIKECEVCQEISSKIDHSRRLSKSVKDDDFDSLFASHLSEHYMNINSEKHLSNNIEQRLFERTQELMKNGESRALDSNSQSIYNNLKTDKDKLQFWLEQNKQKYQENFDHSETIQKMVEGSGEFSLTLKDIILAEALLKRKKYKK